MERDRGMFRRYGNRAGRGVAAVAGRCVRGAGRVASGRRIAVAGVAVIAVLAVTAATPEAAHACPVCFDRDDEARLAFLATTGLLTLLPLGLVAGTGAWLRRRAREVRGDEGGGDGHRGLD